MHKDRLAEWLLTLATSRERAASIVGDLLEGAATRGRFWFWSSVLRTTASQLWRGFTADPANMLGLALRAWLVGWVYLLVEIICIIIGVALYGLAFGILGATGLGWVFENLVRWPLEVVGLGASMFCQFQVGRWIARRAPGREISASLALMIIQLVLGGVMGLGILLATRGSQPPGLSADINNASGSYSDWPSWGWQLLVMNLPCFAGALSVRKRAVP